MVPISITGRNGVTPRQKDHARDKVGKLERYFNGINRIEVVLDSVPERCRAEVLISVRRGSQIVCHHDDSDLYTAIDLALHKAEAQLTRYKEKLQGRRPSHKPGFEYPEVSGSALGHQIGPDEDAGGDDGE